MRIRLYPPLLLYFEEFYPDNGQNISFTYMSDKEKFNVTIYLDSTCIEPIPLNEVKKCSTYPSGKICLEIEGNLKDNQLDPLITDIYEKIIYVIKSCTNNYWVISNKEEFTRALYDAEVFENGSWRNLFKVPTYYAESRIRLNGITQENWKVLNDQLNNKVKPDFLHYVINNALHHFEQKNYRSAILEM